MIIIPEALRLAAEGWSHPSLPVLFYRAAFPADGAAAALMEQRFAANGWPAQWRDGVYTYHHQHPNTHEMLGFAAGSARLRLGGPDGITLDVAAGDAVLLPAGTGHMKISSSDDFLVVGAYPPGVVFDTCRISQTEDMLADIHAVQLPMTEPVNGGALSEFWS